MVIPDAGYPEHIAGPRGYWPSVFFLQMTSSSPKDFDKFADDWFPWPRRELDAHFWLRAGEVICWTKVPWRPPALDGDQLPYEQALYCFDSAKAVDPEIDLPEAAIRELKDLSDGTLVLATTPIPEGIGYYRRVLNRPLPGNWTAAIPGYWQFESDDDGTFYWFGYVTIRVLHFTVASEDGSPGNARQHAGSIENDGPEETIELEVDALSFYISLSASRMRKHALSCGPIPRWMISW